MTENYKLVRDYVTGGIDETVVQRLSDGAFIQAGGRFWKDFQDWKNQGNTPLAVEELPTPQADISSQLVALLIDKGVIAASDLPQDALAAVNADLAASGSDAIAEEVKP